MSSTAAVIPRTVRPLPEPAPGRDTHPQRLRERILDQAREHGLSGRDRERLSRALHRFEERGPVSEARREQFLRHVRTFIERHGVTGGEVPEVPDEVKVAQPGTLDLLA